MPVVAAERLGSLVVGVLVVVPFGVGLGVGAYESGTARGEVVTTFVDPEIVESSGLVVGDGRVVTTNDSGDEGRVFVVDPVSGRTVGVTRWADDPTDVEALAPAGPGHVWVGDIGDNLGRRDTIQVTKVPVADSDQTVDEETVDLVLPGGGRDAEALLVHPRTGRLYVVTKGALAGEVLAAPAVLEDDAPNRLRAVGRAPGMVTDGAFFPDGRHVVVRTYSRVAVLAFPSFAPVASWKLPSQPQGEGVAVGPDGGIYLSSEGVEEPLLRVQVPARAARAMVSPGPRDVPTASTDEPAPGPAADPAADQVTGAEDRVWSWVLSGLVLAGIVLVLVRSVRPPR